MEREVTQRYVAHLKVERVTVREVRSASLGRDNSSREIEAFSVTVRSATLDGLKQKVDAHLGLVDDDDFGKVER